MNNSAEANFMMVLSIALPLAFIVASKWLVPALERKFGAKAKTVYFVVAFVIIILAWYFIDTRYGFHQDNRINSRGMRHREETIRKVDGVIPMF
jgi:uncharacterized membrane protein